MKKRNFPIPHLISLFIIFLIAPLLSPFSPFFFYLINFLFGCHQKLICYGNKINFLYFNMFDIEKSLVLLSMIFFLSSIFLWFILSNIKSRAQQLGVSCTIVPCTHILKAILLKLFFLQKQPRKSHFPYSVTNWRTDKVNYKVALQQSNSIRMINT